MMTKSVQVFVHIIISITSYHPSAIHPIHHQLIPPHQLNQMEKKIEIKRESKEKTNLMIQMIHLKCKQVIVKWRVSLIVKWQAFVPH